MREPPRTTTTNKNYYIFAPINPSILSTVVRTAMQNFTHRPTTLAFLVFKPNRNGGQSQYNLSLKLEIVTRVYNLVLQLLT